MENLHKQDSPRVLKVLEALKHASRELQSFPADTDDDSNSPAIKALLELQTESDTILAEDPNLSALCQHLSDLKTKVESLQKLRGHHSLRSFLSRLVYTHSISRIAGSIQSEIQAWIDRESIDNLTRALKEPVQNDEVLVKLLIQFEERVSEGFNRDLQDLVLKSKVFPLLESILCDAKFPKRIRERCAYTVAALIRFNKDVFVGQVLMGPTIRSLVTMSSLDSIKVLCKLIKLTKSPLVDEIESNGEIPHIIELLNSPDLQMRLLAMDCVLEIAYFGRKEAVDAMLREGLVKKLVELQRSELGGDLIDLGRQAEKESKGVSEAALEGRREKTEKRFLESHPFASCVASFAVQLEIGEGLRQREKRAFKQQILVKVKEACVSDAEAATIVAEVLWGSSL